MRDSIFENISGSDPYRIINLSCIRKFVCLQKSIAGPLENIVAKNARIQVDPIYCISKFRYVSLL